MVENIFSLSLRRITSICLLVITFSLFAQNNAIRFDGAGDYIEIEANDQLAFESKDFTISFWVSFDDINRRNNGLFGRNNYQWLTMEYNNDNDRRLTFGIDGNGSYNWNFTLKPAKNDWVANQWYNIAIVRLNNLITIYIDGEVAASGNYTGSVFNPVAVPLYFGRNQLSTEFHLGLLDDIRIWNYGLSQADLKSSMNTGITGTEPGLTAYWNFNESAGATAFDGTTNDNDALLRGDAVFVASDSPLNNTPEAQTFSCVTPTGLPYNIVITGVNIDGRSLPRNTQIAVFDGSLCVGSAVRESEENLPLVAWQSDASNGLSGFTSGNPMGFKVRTEWFSEMHVFNAVPEFASGDGSFGTGSYSALSLNITTNLSSAIESSVEYINFTATSVDSISTESVIISNVGNAPLNVTAISTSLNIFTVSKTSMFVPAGGRDTVLVSFDPAHVTEYNEILTFISDDPSSPQLEVVLHGAGLEGYAPEIIVSPTEIIYPGIAKSTIRTKDFTVTNIGPGRLDVTNIVVSGNDFTVVGPVNFSLEQNESQRVEVQFTPLTKGAYSTILTINSNAGNRNIELNGVASDGYYTPVSPTGTPYIVVVDSLDISGFGLYPGDEVAIFDDTLCVGVGISSRGATGTFKGEYYYSPGTGSGPVLGNHIFTREDENISFNWGNGGPGNGIGNDDFQVKWTGLIYADTTGNYTFRSYTDDGASLYINDQHIINAWRDQGMSSYTGSIYLEKGLHNLTFNYYENGGGAGAYLYWTRPGRAETLVRASEKNHNQLAITTWQKDVDHGYVGFTPGNPMSFKVWTNVYNEELEIIPNVTYTIGDGRFGSGSYSVVNLTADAGLEPDMVLYDTKIYVGQVKIGQSVRDSLLIRNTGNAVLEFLLDSDSPQFGLSQNSGQVQPNDSVYVYVTFTPSQVGSNNGVLTISSNDPDSKLTELPLEGFALPTGVANIEISTENMVFNGTVIGTPSVKTFNIINTGTAPLVVSNIVVNNSAFTVQPTSFTLENTNDNIEIQLTFAPTFRGKHVANLSISSNASTRVVTAEGVGFDGHFNSVAGSGLPYMIVVDSSDLYNYLAIGDEIAVFDGGKCVGTSAILSDTGNIVITAWQADSEQGLDGYIPGHTMQFKVWTAFQGFDSELDATALYQIGDGTFGFGQFSAVNFTFTKPDIEVSPTELFVALNEPDSVIENLRVTNTGNDELYYSINTRNYASVFDGSGDYINLGNGSSINNIQHITVEAWINQNSHSGYRNAVSNYRGGSDSWLIRTSQNGNGHFTPHVRVNNTWYSLDCGYIEPGEWIHVAMTYDGEVLRGFVNGVLIAENTSPSGIINRPSGLSVIGGAYGSEWFHGEVDEVRIWDHARSELEIQQNYKSRILAHEPGLAGYWNFDEGSVRDYLNLNNSVSTGNTHVSQSDLFSLSDWLTVENPSDTLMPGTNVDLNVLINSKGLIDGMYTSELRIENNVPGKSPFVVPVSLNVTGKGQLQSSHDSVSFGERIVGRTDTVLIAIQNIGSKVLHLDELYLISGVGYSISQAFTLPDSLTPFESREFEVVFTPLTNGVITDSIIILTNRVDHDTLYIGLSGEGITPPDIDFNMVSWSDTLSSGAFSTDTVYIKNTGQADLDYTIQENVSWLSLAPMSGTIVVGDSAQVIMDASANSLYVGNYSGAVNILSNDPDEPELVFTATLTVTGTPEISTLQSANFGEVNINTTKVFNLTVQNTGADTLFLESTTLSNTLFSIDTIEYIAPGAIDTFNIIFTPVATGNYSEILTIRSNAVNSPELSIPIYAKGIKPAEIQVSPSSINRNIASNTIGQTTLTISNVGGKDLIYNLSTDRTAGNALALDGDGDYLNIINAPVVNPDSAITLEAWIYANDNINQFIIAKEHAYGCSYLLKLNNEGRLEFILNNSISLESASVVPAGQWVHIAASYDGFTQSLFINGGTVGSREIPGIRISYNSENLRIGRSFGTTYFNGQIDELRMWEIGRNESEISGALSQSLAGNEKGLILYYTFNETSGIIARDKSLNNIDGTFYGNSGRTISNVNIDNILSLSSTTGRIDPGLSNSVNVEFNANGVYNNTKTRTIFIESNDSLNSQIEVPVQLNITGNSSLEASSAQLTFADTYIGTADTLEFQLINSGSTSIEISQYLLDSEHFSLLNGYGEILPYSYKNIRVAFHPQVYSSLRDTLTIISNADNQTTHSVVLEGGAIRPPVIDLSSRSFNETIDFGQTTVSQLVIRNNGEGELYFNITGDAPGWVSLSQNSGAVSANDSLTLNITFAGSEDGGAYQTVLAIQSNDIHKPEQQVVLDLWINGAEVSVTPEQLVSYVTYQETGLDTLYIQNTGVAPLYFGFNTNVNYLSFSVDTGLVAPGATEEVYITTNGDLPHGKYQPIINIYTNDPLNPVVKLQQKLTILDATLVFFPQEADFAGVLIGESASLRLKLLNNGNVDVTIDSIYCNAPFTTGIYQNILLRPDSSTFVDVDFVPTEIKVETDTLFVQTGTRLFKVPMLAEGIQLPGTVSNMLPADSAAALSLPLQFSWSPARNAKLYDVYIWEDSTARPSQPVKKDLSQIAFSYSGLGYGKTYQWQVVAKNYAYTNEGPVQRFTVQQIADLVVNNIQTPANAFSGQVIDISWEIQNNGQGSTGQKGWYDEVYLSTDKTFENHLDYYLGGVANLSYLNSQENYSQTAAFKLPEGISGEYTVFVITNRSHRVIETDYTNNLSMTLMSMTIELTPPPDLQITKIITPANVFSGQPITVAWEGTNKGSGETKTASWWDYVYISDSQELNISAADYLGRQKHTGELKPDSTWNLSLTATVPNNIFGTYYVHVVTDHFNNVYEHATENNNSGHSDSIDVILTPPPDLMVTGMVVPDSASVNQSIDIQWTVANYGGTPASNKWNDKLYISPTPDFANSIYLGQLRNSTALNPGDEYVHTKEFKLPDNISGAFYAFVVTDANNEVFEYEHEDNNRYRRANTFEILSPDLAVLDIQVTDSAQSGDTLVINWTLKNQGPGDVYNQEFEELVYISKSSQFIPDSLTLLVIRKNSLYMAKGDSVSHSAEIILNDSLSGNYYFWVVADPKAVLYEPAKRENNTARSTIPIYVGLSPWADLEISGVTIPDSAYANSFIAVEYTITNIGAKDLNGASWKDGLYLSHDILFSNAVELTKLNQSVTLHSDSSISFSYQVQLPADLSRRKYYLFIEADVDNEIYEHGSETNNRIRSAAIFVDNYPVDLMVSEVLAPDSSSSGNVIPVQWTVINPGEVPTMSTFWYDAVYLSADTILDASDIFIDNVKQARKLISGESYQQNLNIELPNGISGNYYLLAVADYTHLNNEPDYSNNYLTMKDQSGIANPIHISLTPGADLVPVMISAPAEGVAAQPVKVKWTVVNEGPGRTNTDTWTESLWLSTDTKVSGADYKLANYVRKGVLEAGESYTDSLEIMLPLGYTGNYVIIFQSDLNKSVYEAEEKWNNTKASNILISQPPPCDLVVSSVITTDTLLAGLNANIQWEIKNVGQNPARGVMKDIVYISKDTIWDVDDAIFGVYSGNINIAPKGTNTRNITAPLTDVSLGEYYVIVRSDILNNIFEIREDNNKAVSQTPVYVTVEELLLHSKTNTQLTDYRELYYRIEIPDSLAEETMYLTLKGDSLYGENELYLSYNEMPTRVVHDFGFDNPFYGNQEITVPSLNAGTYYLMVYGNTRQGNQQEIELYAKKMDFEILSVKADKGGNSGRITFTVEGSKFTPDMEVVLQHDTTDFIISDTVIFVDATKIYATLDLRGAKPGMYHVLADKINKELTHKFDAFEVLNRSVEDLQINIQAPSNTRPGGIVSLRIEFKNAGTNDLEVPEVLMNSVAGAPVGFTVEELKEGNTSLIIPLRELNGPEDVLRPGVERTITIYARASSALGFSFIIPGY